MANPNKNWLFQSRIAIFLLIAAFLVLYHGIKTIDVLTAISPPHGFEYLQSAIRGLIVFSLLAVMMRVRFSRLLMWISITALIASQYWVHYMTPELLNDASRSALSYLRGFILPAILTWLYIPPTSVLKTQSEE